MSRALNTAHPASLAGWMTSRPGFGSFRLPVTAAAFSFAVFEQSAGSVLLHVFLLRRMTGRTLEEHVLQRWAGCDEPHAGGPGC